MDCPIPLLVSITPLLNFNSEEPNPVNEISSYWSYRISEGFFHDSYHPHLERDSSLLEGLTKSIEPSQSDDYLSCLCSASWFFSSNDGNNSESCDVLKNAGMDHAGMNYFRGRTALIVLKMSLVTTVFPGLAMAAVAWHISKRKIGEMFKRRSSLYSQQMNLKFANGSLATLPFCLRKLIHKTMVRSNQVTGTHDHG